MNNTAMALLAALIVQIGLALFLGNSQTNFTATDPTEQVLKGNVQDADKITIFDREKKSTLVLKRPVPKIWRWVMPDYYDFPCHDYNIKRLFDRLADMKRGWTLATTADATKRFNCTDDTCEKIITLWKGDKVIGKLFIGKTNRLNHVNVRLDGENNIYQAELERGVADVKPTDWLDNRFADLKPGAMTRVDFNNKFVIERDQKNQWVITGDGQKLVIHNDTADEVFQRLADFTIKEILGTEDKPEYNMSTPTLHWDVVMKEDKKRTYKLAKPATGDYRILKMSDAPYYMKIETFYEIRLNELTWDWLKRVDISNRKVEEAKMKDQALAKQEELLKEAAKKSAGPVAPAGK
ncbi:MAG: DUF4340 domain-containing protein [Cyanobacteria bacterium]|nr:DUF4340 domain-containing protein [Cyanobacteriota bacterium]